MDKERIRQAALGRRGTGRGGGRERVRLVVYAIVIAAIGSYVLVQRRGDGAPGAQQSAAKPEELVPLQALAEYEPFTQIEPARLAAVADATAAQRAFVEPDAREHLLVEASELVYGDMEYLGAQPADRDALLADPAGHRGAPLWVLGRLEWSDANLAANPPEIWGELRDEHDRTWLFLVAEPFADVRVGDVVKLKGFFFKLHDRQRPDGSFASGPLLVGEELLPSAFRIEPVTALRPDLFYGVRDGSLLEASRPLAGRAYYELLSFVQHTPPEQLFGATPPPTAYAVDLMRESEAWRGRPVSVRGRVLHSQSFPLGPEGENPLGVPRAWQTWLFNSGAVTLAVSLDPPPAFVPDETIVDVDGIYFRRYGYENKQDEARVAAVVIASRFREFVIPPSPITMTVAITVGVLTLVVTALLFAAAWKDRASGRAGRRRAVQRKKRLIEQPGHLHEARAAAGTAPPARPAAPSGPAVGAAVDRPAPAPPGQA